MKIYSVYGNKNWVVEVNKPIKTGKGKPVDDIFKGKKLRYREDILDNMNEDNQMKQKLIRDNIQGENNAKHYEVGKIPEEIPSPKKSLQEKTIIK